MQTYEIALIVGGCIMLCVMVKLAINEARTLGGGKE